MGARILDWLAVHKANVVSFVIGLIVGAVLANLDRMVG